MWINIAGYGKMNMLDEFRGLNYPDNNRTIRPVDFADMPARLERREKIEVLESAIYGEISSGRTEELDMYGDNLQHHFIDGVYARELFIPAGMVVIGKLHKYPRICIISQGEVSFVTEFGAKRVQASYVAVMPPGTKTALYTHSDVVWTAIHGTDETDIQKLEQIFVARNHAELTADERKMLGE